MFSVTDGKVRLLKLQEKEDRRHPVMLTYHWGDALHYIPLTKGRGLSLEERAHRAMAGGGAFGDGRETHSWRPHSLLRGGKPGLTWR